MKRADFAEIMAGTKRYAELRADEDPQYTKHPTTWLTSDCWADEVPPARPRRPAGRDAHQNPPDESGYLQSMFGEDIP